MKTGRIFLIWVTMLLFVSSLAPSRLFLTNRPVCPMMPTPHLIGASAPSALPACCQAHSPALQSIFGHCSCCDFSPAPERPEPPAVVPVLADVVFLPPVQAVVQFPPVVATSIIRLPLPDEDAPRGPPPRTLSPRAPPLFS